MRSSTLEGAVVLVGTQEGFREEDGVESPRLTGLGVTLVFSWC